MPSYRLALAITVVLDAAAHALALGGRAAAVAAEVGVLLKSFLLFLLVLHATLFIGCGHRRDGDGPPLATQMLLDHGGWRYWY